MTKGSGAAIMRYNADVIRRRLAPILAILTALLLSVSGVGQAAAWQCQGQQCGVMPWQCCCEAPKDECDAPRDAADVALASTDCPSGCGCIMVITSRSDEAIVAAAPLLIPSYAALCPVGITFLAVPAPSELLVRVVTPRGPPLPTLVCPGAVSLRAPPVA